MNLLKRLSIIFVVFVVSLASVGIIYAQGPDDAPGPKDGNRVGPMLATAIVKATAQATDTLPLDVIQARADGQSINDYITANGGDPAAVQETVLTQAELRIERAVENDRLTQDEADALLADLETQVGEIMASTEPLELDRPFRDGRPGREGREGRPSHEGRPHRHFDFGLMDIISEATGLQPAEIVAELRSSETTLAELIVANGGDVEEVENRIIGVLVAQINDAVAEGKITQEMAETALENAETRVNDLLNREFEGRRPPEGRRGPGFGGGDDSETEGVLE